MNKYETIIGPITQQLKELAPLPFERMIEEMRAYEKAVMDSYRNRGVIFKDYIPSNASYEAQKRLLHDFTNSPVMPSPPLIPQRDFWTMELWEKDHANLAFEVAAVFDRFGRHLKTITQYKTHYVNFNTEEVELLVGNRMTHNHPYPLLLSPADVLMLIRENMEFVRCTFPWKNGYGTCEARRTDFKPHHVYVEKMVAAQVPTVLNIYEALSPSPLKESIKNGYLTEYLPDLSIALLTRWDEYVEIYSKYMNDSWDVALTISYND